MSLRCPWSPLTRVVVVTVLAVVAALCTFAGTARAVFPGATGRLVVNAQLFDPPADSSQPILSYAPMHAVRFSPDGRRVAGFNCGGSSTDAIYVADADGSNVQQVATTGACEPSADGLAWSPDGKEIAFTNHPRVSCGSSTCPGYGLSAVDVETNVTRQILPATGLGFYDAPDWSPDPDSHELVDVVGGSGPLPAGVDLINSDDGTLVRNVYAANTWPAPMAVRFAPDAASVVVGFGAPEDPPSSFRVQTFPLDGSGGVSFPVKGSIPTPTFTPDGLWVTFADCHPGCGIWSRSLPTANDPGGAYREDVSYPGTSAPSGIPLDWEPLVNAPVITAGPSGRVGTASATFEFSIPSTQQGTYQCRLDGGGWEDGCTSPKTYSGLADGDHKFEVRFYVQGQNPDDAPVASRTWTVDTTPPDAIIDQSPSGQTSSTDATIVFHSSEPDGATFLCSEDGGPEQDCSSPTRLSGLAVGNHTFAVKAVDQVGNTSEAAHANWQVVAGSSGAGGSGGSGGGGGGSGGGGGGTTPPPSLSSCGAKGFANVTAGAVVAVGRFGTCFVRTKKADGSIYWTAAGPITLNGVQINPAGVLTLDQHLASISVELPAGTTLGFGSFTWTLPGSVNVPVSTAGGVAHFFLPNQKKQFKIAGLKVSGKIDFELSTSEGGSSTVSVKLELPAIIQGAAGAEGDGANTASGAKDEKSLTLTFKFIASNDKGVRFAFKGEVSNAWLFGKVQLSKLSVGLDQGPPLTFEGSATLKFPGVVGGKYSITLGLSDQGDQSFPNVTKLALQASELQKPLAEGVFLQRLGGQFKSCTGTDRQTGGELSANAGISFGPKLEIPGLFDGEPASLDGTVTLSLCEPKSIAVKGEGKIVEVSVGSATAKYTWSTGRVDLSGKLDLTIGGWGFLASIDAGNFDMPDHTWSVSATGQLRLPAFLGGALNGQGDVVLSSKGFAACFGKPGHQVGIAKHWHQDLQKFFDSCDVGPYRAGGARAAAAGGPQRVTVPKNDPVALIAVHGSSTAPQVSVTGPGGVRLDSPANGGGLQTARGLIVPDAASRTTYVVLFSPGAGAWNVATAPNTPGTTSLQVADGLPPVQLHARVRRAGGRQQLTWALRPIPGQTVTFIEHGRETDRTLLSTSRGSGHLGFTPAAGPGGRRQIVALVTEHGLPRTRLVVARFTAPPPAKLRAVADLRRRGARIVWKSQPAASRYSVFLSAPSGATVATTTTRARLQVPRAMRGVALTVSVSALDRDDNAGPLRTWVLKP